MLCHEQMSVERGGIAVEAGGSEVGAIAQSLVDRDFTGKAVLHIR
jgi:hypothetical protein